MKCLLFLLLLPAITVAQKQWIFTGPTHKFIVHIDTNLCGGTDGNYCPAVRTIDVFENTGSRKIQTISPQEFQFASYLDSSTVFSAEDMNFDGFQDIRLLSWTSLNLQTTYCYWFYNTVSKTFVQDTSLNEFRNPYFDDRNKTIHSWWRDAFSFYGHSLHKWENGKPVLIIEQTESWGLDTTIPGVVTLTRPIKGKLKEQESEANLYKTIEFMHEDCNLAFALKGKEPCDTAIIVFKNLTNKSFRSVHAIVQGEEIDTPELKAGETSPKFRICTDGPPVFKFSIYFDPTGSKTTVERPIGKGKIKKGSYMYTINILGKGFLDIDLVKLK